jgi:hypothetical protein
MITSITVARFLKMLTMAYTVVVVGYWMVG